jgi:hypothetical protein
MIFGLWHKGQTMKNYTLDDEQYAELCEILEYIYYHEAQGYEESRRDGLENLENHVYARACRLGESLRLAEIEASR